MRFSMELFFVGTMVFFVGAVAAQENAKRATPVGNNTQGADSNIHTEQMIANNLGRFQYQDGEVTIFQNKLMPSDFFFTPFPNIEPNFTDCHYNDLSGHTELTLVVALYTAGLVDSVRRHIKNRNDTCHVQHCGVSLLPMHSIRLVQKGLRTSESKKKYTLDSEWHSNTQLRQTIEFIMYTSNMSICEDLRGSIISRCRLSNLEVQYSLQGQQTVGRSLEVTTEHVTKTSMYNRIKSQLPSQDQDIVALTGNDYKDLKSETIDQITMNLRIEEGYENVPDPVGIEQLLDRQLQYKETRLTKVDDQIWNSLYWTPELTRPDRLSKVLNKVIKEDGTDSDKFVYDYAQADEAVKQDLKIDERQKLERFQKNLAAHSKNTTRTSDIDTHFGIDNSISIPGAFSAGAKYDIDVGVYNQDTDSSSSLKDDKIHYRTENDRFNGTNVERKNGSKIILERKDAEKLLRYLSQHVEVEGDIVKPKPIDLKLVKFGLLKSSTKLFSNTVLVKTRMNVHVLPLRCPYEYRHRSSANGWLAERYHGLSTLVDEGHRNLTIALNGVKESSDTAQLQLDQKLIENRNLSDSFMSELEIRLNRTVEEKFSLSNMLLNATEARLNQTIDEKFYGFETLMNKVESRLIEAMERNVNASHQAMTQIVERNKGKYVTGRAPVEGERHSGYVDLLLYRAGRAS